MLHCMNLNPEPFEMIRSGEKTIELRLYDEKRQLVKAGDEIEFTRIDNPSEKLVVRVKALHRFSNFEELYKYLPLNKCGYSEQNISRATPDDMVAYYSKEKQSKYGVVGIEIELKA